MKAMRVSEANFKNNIPVDFSGNKKLMVFVNLLSLVLFFIFYYVFNLAAGLFSLNHVNNISYFFNSFKELSSVYAIIFVIAFFIILFLHELIHGIFFYFFTKEKPVFGYKVIYAYAGAPDWYVKKKYWENG